MSALTFASVELIPVDQLLPLVLLAGVIGLDVVSFPQVMVSRPIVAATLGGALSGSPMAGLTCGVALECLALESLPVGASRYPEWGSASVVAGAMAANHVSSTGLPEAGPFAVAVLAGVLTSWLGGWSMVKHRQLVGRLARARMDRLIAGDRRAVISLHISGMSMDFLRGVLVATLMLIVSLPVLAFVESRWSIREDLSRAFVVTCVAAVAAASVWKDFHAISGTRRLFLLSLAVGTVAVILGA